MWVAGNDIQQIVFSISHDLKCQNTVLQMDNKPAILPKRFRARLSCVLLSQAQDDLELSSINI